MHRHAGGYLLGRSCRRADRSGILAPPSPYDTAFSERSGSFQAFQGSSPITLSSRSSKAHQKSGSFPPPKLLGLNGTTDPVRLPPAPPPIATLRLRSPPTTAVPRLPASPFRRAVPTTPAD